MAKQKVEKEQFADVPEEFKDAVVGMSIEDIKKRVAQVALDQVELMRAKKQDDDLTVKKEEYKIAGTVYREGTKLNRVKIEYCKMMIESKGGN